MVKKKVFKPLTGRAAAFVISGMLATLERIEKSQHNSLGKEFVITTYGPLKGLLKYLKGG